MAYVITNTRGQTIATILTGQENTTATDLTLIGQNYVEFGLAQNENFVYLLENFAAPTPPLQPIQGQLWFDTANNEIKLRLNVNTWSSLADHSYVQAQKISPAFTGVPTAPTAAPGTNTTQLATTAFVTSAVNNIDLSPYARLDGATFTGNIFAPTAPLGTVNTRVATTAFARALFDDVNTSLYVPRFDGEMTGNARAPTLANIFDNSNSIATTGWVQNLYGNVTVSLYAPKVDANLQGVPTTPTASVTTANTQIASTAFVHNLFGNVDLSPYAPKASPVLTGTPRAPTANASDNSTLIATTEFVQLQKISPAFTGAPTAPTAANTTANTQIATTEFVTSKIAEINASGAQELAGSVKLWISQNPPDGWALCNGEAVSRTVYARLFSRIGTTYGAGDGSTTFNLPNLSARFPIGVGTGYALGSTGGFADASVISHTHPASTSISINDPGHSHQYTTKGGNRQSPADEWNGIPGKLSTNIQTSSNVTGITASATTSISAPANSTEGTGRNIPPYQSFYYIIKMSDDGSGGGTLEAGAGIDIATGNGRSTITNVGVRRLIAGSGITLSSETGNITISSSGGSGTADIAGTIKIWGGATEPTDWMFCDGRAISRTEYVSLFSRIGTAFGAGDGSSTFNIPDFRNRTAVGSSATKARGSTGALDYAPIGSVVAWTATGAIPNGWLLCNGSTSSRTTEAALFAVIGTTYNTGGESSTVFRLPDYRAMFLRGLDEGRGIDPLRALNGPVPFQKGTLHWSDCGDSPGSAPGDTGIYAFTSGVDYQSSAPYHGSTVKNVGKDSFGAVRDLYSAAYIATEFTYAGAGFAAKTTSPTGRPIVINTGFTSPSTNQSPQTENALYNQQFPDGYYGRDFVWGITRPHNMAVRYIIKARPTTTESDVGYQSAPYIIKVNDNGTQRSGSGGGDTSRAGDVKWVAYAPNNFPPGWQLCDGSELLRASYPALFARIGTTYGAGNGTTTFNVPDLRGRFIASETAGATGANRANITRGGVGGSADAVVVSHTHDYRIGQSAGTLTPNIGGWNFVGTFPATNYPGFIQQAGESGTDKNLPPYVGMVAMIKLDDDTVNTGGIIQAGPGISITTSGSYATISSTISQNPVVAGPGITVQNAPGGALVSANVRNIVPAAGSSITVTNNNGVFEIGGGGTGGGGGGYGPYLNFTNTRSKGVTYTNNTGRSLLLEIYCAVEGINQALNTLSIGGVEVATMGHNTAGANTGSFQTLVGVVNPGVTYRFDGQGRIIRWVEAASSGSNIGSGTPAFTGALWQTVSKVPGVTYFNDSIQPLQVSVSALLSGGPSNFPPAAPGVPQQNWFFVNEQPVAQIGGSIGGGAIPPAYVYAIVPPGGSYRLATVTGVSNIVWRELSGGIGGGGGGEGGLGYGQTWQNVLSSRAANTNYTNTTGKPIQVAITAGSPQNSEFLVDNVNVARVPGNVTEQVTAIVPPGSTYRINQNTPGIVYWAELR